MPTHVCGMEKERLSSCSGIWTRNDSKVNSVERRMPDGRTRNAFNPAFATKRTSVQRRHVRSMTSLLLLVPNESTRHQQPTSIQLHWITMRAVERSTSMNRQFDSLVQRQERSYAICPRHPCNTICRGIQKVSIANEPILTCSSPSHRSSSHDLISLN